MCSACPSRRRWPIKVCRTLPQPPATTAYAIDNSVGKAKFGGLGPIVFAPPGQFKLPLYIDLGSPFLMCKAQSVSINKGAGFNLLGALGAVQSVTHTLPDRLQPVVDAASAGHQRQGLDGHRDGEDR